MQCFGLHTCSVYLLVHVPHTIYLYVTAPKIVLGYGLLHIFFEDTVASAEQAHHSLLL